MRFKKMMKHFEDGNVCVIGLRGRGKDMLQGNVIVRRKKPYISNTDYGEIFTPWSLISSTWAVIRTSTSLRRKSNTILTHTPTEQTFTFQTWVFTFRHNTARN